MPHVCLKPSSKSTTIHKQTRINLGKKQVVDLFMKQYDTIIKETIQKNNEKIYTELLEFLAP